MIKVLGLLILVISVLIIRDGIKYKDTSYNLVKAKQIVGGALLAFLAIAMLFTDKSFCEVFGLLC